MTETIAFVDGEMPEIGTSGRMPEQVKGVTGGMAVNAARACRKWGSLNFLITKAGKHLGNRLADEFKERLLLCPARDDAESATCVTLVHASKDLPGRERTFLLFPGKHVNVSCGDLDSPQVTDAMRQTSHIHFAGVGDGGDDANTDPMCFDNVKFLSQLKRWREAGITISVDFAPIRHRLTSPKWRRAIDGVLQSADFLFPSDIEAVLFTSGLPSKTPELTQDLIEDAAEKLSTAYPSSIVIVKAKDLGCYCPDLESEPDGGWVTAEANINMKDPTGAGDVFCGAFLTAWRRLSATLPKSELAAISTGPSVKPELPEQLQSLRRAIVKICAVYGNAAAADSLAKIGGGRELPPWDEISRNRVAHHPALKPLFRNKKSPVFYIANLLGAV